MKRLVWLFTVLALLAVANADAQPDAELDALFWQSVMNSRDPAEFEAYLEQFPEGTFRLLAEARLRALRRPRPGTTFRDCEVCPQVVVQPGSSVALGRYEVTIEEYYAFALATGGGNDTEGGCGGFGPRRADGSWRSPGIRQNSSHPVTCISWDDTQAYLSWLSQRTGARYRLPTDEEWEAASIGTQPGGCSVMQKWKDRGGRTVIPVEERGTCEVGSYSVNRAGLYDMAASVSEWLDGCFDPTEENVCRRGSRGGDWTAGTYEAKASESSYRARTDIRLNYMGFRVAKELD